MNRFDAEDASDPIALFQRWLQAAEVTEVNDPNAMALATATSEGRPSVRMVLLKKVDVAGFTFYTNDQSQKGVELTTNPHAALCFHWKSQRRQVRVEGLVEDVPPEDSEEYFHSRSRKSQIGAVASQQSRPLESREALEAKAHKLETEFPGEVPRPAYWRGFRVVPKTIEFWQDGPNRLHDRIVFTCGIDGWGRQRLYP